MTDTIKVALIGIFGIFIVQAVQIWLALRNHDQGLKNHKQGEEIHVMINNRMSQLLEAAKMLSHNEGVTEGGAAVRDAMRIGETPTEQK